VFCLLPLCALSALSGLALFRVRSCVFSHRRLKRPPASDLHESCLRLFCSSFELLRLTSTSNLINALLHRRRRPVSVRQQRLQVGLSVSSSVGHDAKKQTNRRGQNCGTSSTGLRYERTVCKAHRGLPAACGGGDSLGVTYIHARSHATHARYETNNNNI